MLFFGLGTSFQNDCIGSFLGVGFLDFAQFIIDFEVPSGQYLKNAIPVILKEEDILVCFEFGIHISKTLGSEHAHIILGTIFIALNQNSMAIAQVAVVLVL